MRCDLFLSFFILWMTLVLITSIVLEKRGGSSKDSKQGSGKKIIGKVLSAIIIYIISWVMIGVYLDITTISYKFFAVGILAVLGFTVLGITTMSIILKSRRHVNEN